MVPKPYVHLFSGCPKKGRLKEGDIFLLWKQKSLRLTLYSLWISFGIRFGHVITHPPIVRYRARIQTLFKKNSALRTKNNVTAMI